MEYIKNLLYYFASQFLPNFNPYPIKRDTQLGRRQSNQTYKFIDLDPVFFDYQQKDPDCLVPSLCWNEPDDKKYNPSPHEMDQDHGHV